MLVHCTYIQFMKTDLTVFENYEHTKEKYRGERRLKECGGKLCKRKLIVLKI